MPGFGPRLRLEEEESCYGYAVLVGVNNAVPENGLAIDVGRGQASCHSLGDTHPSLERCLH